MMLSSVCLSVTEYNIEAVEVGVWVESYTVMFLGGHALPNHFCRGMYCIV